MPDRADGRRYLRTSDPRGSPSATLAVALAAAAALSAGAGVFLLSTEPEPAKPAEQGPVGMEPTVLGISGKLP
jgi:hypothetical protein